MWVVVSRRVMKFVEARLVSTVLSMRLVRLLLLSLTFLVLWDLARLLAYSISNVLVGTAVWRPA